ncbi:hypothetical protein ABPG72_005494 [Tetrahymena utriculariae]
MLKNINLIRRYFCQAIKHEEIQDLDQITIAIVGGGPAGFYTAKKILSDNDQAHVHIFEKLPFPYGLVRYGVAPDHQPIKKIINDFKEVSHNPRLKFYGNVTIGRDISVKEITENYSGVVYSYGAQNDKKLGIPGENVKNVFSGREIVNWYNGHPDYCNLPIDFSKIKNIVIVGNGNVALDVARILIKAKTGELDDTDITAKSLSELKRNNIENIFLVGRRGLIQAQFSMKEFRAFSQTKGANFYVWKDEYERSLNENSKWEFSDQMNSATRLARINKRRYDIIKNLQQIQNLNEIQNNFQINVHLKALLSPFQVNSENGYVSSVDFNRNILKGEPFEQKSFVEESLGTENIKCDLLIRCIGYESENIDGIQIPWDFSNNKIAHHNGCVLQHNSKDKIQIGKYASGWVKTGPIGVLDQTMLGCIETTNNIENHINHLALVPKKDCEEKINQILKERKVEAVSIQDWEKIDAYEIKKGQQNKKIREKIINIEEALELLRLQQ